jgi:hypothetical protein
MDKRINIGAFSRLVIKQILGGEKGQGVIDAIEQGLGSAIGALARRDVAGFLLAIPPELRAQLVEYAKKAL